MDIYFTMAIVIYLYRTQLYDCATFHLAIVVVLVVIAHYSAGFHSATVPTVILQLIYIESHGLMAQKAVQLPICAKNLLRYERFHISYLPYVASYHAHSITVGQ